MAHNFFISVLSSRYQTFTVRVNDVYVTLGNTAVVQCSIDPYYVRDYVAVTSWTQNGVAIRSGMTSSRSVMIASDSEN